MSRRARLWAAALAAALLAACALIAAQGTGLVRTHGGDVAVVGVLYFGLRALTGRRPAACAAWVFGSAALVEVSQAAGLAGRLGLEGTPVGTLLLGSTFDAGDLGAYALGVLLSVGLDTLLLRQFDRAAA